MSGKRKILGAFLLAAAGLIFDTSSAWAHKNNTTAWMNFSDNPAVDGTLVTVTGTVVYDGTCSGGNPNGHVCASPNTPITGGIIQLHQLRLNGDPVACGTLGADYFNIAQGSPNVSGQFSTNFDTTGYGDQMIGFRAHHPAAGGGSHGNSQTMSECFDLRIYEVRDPLPDGTTSYTQGFYGSSPVGEAVVEHLMDEKTCERIYDILQNVGVATAADGCYSTLPLMLTGTVGPGRDNGFLPSGFLPGQNMAAQLITLLLNLNLAYVLPADAFPLLRDYYINIDVVEDLFGNPPLASDPPTFVDPIKNIPELGTCTDSDADSVCDASTEVLTALGDKVADLDAFGTTVEDILNAAFNLLQSGALTIDVNRVTLTKGDLTQILGLINESFDEGVATGFVTAFDAD